MVTLVPQRHNLQFNDSRTKWSHQISGELRYVKITLSIASLLLSRMLYENVLKQ